MDLEKELERQTLKMLNDMRAKRKLIVAPDGDVIKNLDAYISDTEHFLEKKDLIRAFEAIVYAWGILETLEHVGIVRENDERKNT